MKTLLRWSFSILLASAMAAQPAVAYDYPLSSEAIREAYFLGSGNPGTFSLFLEKYIKRYPVPKSGVYVGLIEFETPYVLVAEKVARNVSNYSAPDAVQEFLGKPGLCRVRVEVYWGYAGSPSVTGRSIPYQIDYVLRVKQNDKEIPVKAKWTESLIAPSSAPVDIGIAFTNEYDADKIDSAPVTVEVVDPNGKTLVESFDVDSLR